jgi:AcrR family transcriptional regulator
MLEHLRDSFNPSNQVHCVAVVTARTSDEPLSKGEQTRQAILRAAVTRFGRDGYRATSVADIARDAGVGGTVAYAYFPGKEALFLAAVDHDAAAVIGEGLATVIEHGDRSDWRRALVFTLLAAIDRHPLARRLLAGLEPDVTDRVMTTPALEELRQAFADRLRADQAAGTVRHDIEPDSFARGFVAITLSLLMSMVQVGPAAAATYGDDVAKVLEAALGAPR